jgi:hypothetical protein
MKASDLEILNDYIASLNNDYLYKKDPFIPGRFKIDTFTEVTPSMLNNPRNEITFMFHDSYFKCHKEFVATFTVERTTTSQSINSNIKTQIQHLLKGRI